MKLYCYSSELHTFVDARWAIVKFVAGRVFIGTVIILGVLKLYQFYSTATESRPPSVVAAENRILRQQLNLISPRLKKLELQTQQFQERVNTLYFPKKEKGVERAGPSAVFQRISLAQQ